MSAGLKNNMDISTVLKVVPQLPNEISVLLRGPTGIGKSQITKQLADMAGIPLIDVRGSTMDEAKATGIPDFETSKEHGVATFVMCSWYVRACREPCVLFLDEINRSMPQVMQAFFQVVLDRCLGNDKDGEPWPLHPGTRVVAAGNFGSEYDVVEMDPALLRRFWTVDLEPDLNGWIEWASKKGLHPVLIDFIRENPAHWYVDLSAKKVTPGQVIPTPATWERIDTSLKHANVNLFDICGKPQDLFTYSLVRGFVGTEAAQSFTRFVEKYENVISAEDLLNGKVEIKKVLKFKASELSDLINKVTEHCGENDWTPEQVDRALAFCKALPGELQMTMYYALIATRRMSNVKHFHATIGLSITKTINGARAKSENGTDK